MRLLRRLLPAVLDLLRIRPARPGWVAGYCRPFRGRGGGTLWRPDSVEELSEMMSDDLSGVRGRHELAVIRSLSRLTSSPRSP